MIPRPSLHEALYGAHWLIILGGALGVLSVLAGVVSRRIGAPVLLAFLALGMLSGTDGILGIPFVDFAAAYVIGSVALAVILFQGGLQTTPAVLRSAFWPAVVLATIGVVITAAVVGGCVAWLLGRPLMPSLVAGAIVAPTDAAAVAVLLTGARVCVPQRLSAVLEVESGFNDPMSIFLTFVLLRLLVDPGSVSPGQATLSFIEEMAGGALIGIAGGRVLALALRRLPLESALASVLGFAGVICIFGIAQIAGASGFLATYVAGIVTGARAPALRGTLTQFFEGLGWLAQIVLFLMLGLLIVPHDLPPLVPAAIAGTAVLIFVARPAAVFICLLPFGFTLRETAFASWVGLRGAVPIYVSFIPALVDPVRDANLFAAIFIVVVASLVVQGWTVGTAARLLGFTERGDSGRR